jgi:hypothetical protein
MDKELIMAKIAYNGMEKLEEITETKVFDEPHDMFVWNNSDNVPTRRSVCAIIPYRHAGSVITTNGAYEHCAEIPEKPAPRMATNRELARWLAQGNGEVIDSTHYINTYHEYFRCLDKDEVHKTIQVRKWDDTEWHEPTVDYMGIADVTTFEDVVKREG